MFTALNLHLQKCLFKALDVTDHARQKEVYAFVPVVLISSKGKVSTAFVCKVSSPTPILPPTE
jgi:hypothetical protein